MRGSWRPNKTATYWPPLLWPSALLSRSPDAAQPVLAFSTASCHQRVWSPKTKWLPVFTELYNSSIAHSVSSHNWPSECVTSAVFGMACLSSSSRNNCHVVHMSLSSGASVCDCTAGFYLVPYCQPSPPTRFLPYLAIGMCHFHRPWNGMFGGVGGQYTTIVLCHIQDTCCGGSYPFAKKQLVYYTAPVDWATGFSLRESYSSAEMQSVYSTAPADWANLMLSLLF